jgi:hypothetical protein
MKTSDSVYNLAVVRTPGGMTVTQGRTFWQLHRKLCIANDRMGQRLYVTNKRGIGARTRAAEAIAAAAFQLVRLMHEVEKNK